MKYYIILGATLGFVLGLAIMAGTFGLFELATPAAGLPAATAAFPRRERAYHWLADMLENFDYDQFEIPPADRCNIYYWERDAA